MRKGSTTEHGPHVAEATSQLHRSSCTWPWQGLLQTSAGLQNTGARQLHARGLWLSETAVYFEDSRHPPSHPCSVAAAVAFPAQQVQQVACNSSECWITRQSYASGEPHGCSNAHARSEWSAVTGLTSANTLQYIPEHIVTTCCLWVGTPHACCCSQDHSLRCTGCNVWYASKLQQPTYMLRQQHHNDEYAAHLHNRVCSGARWLQSQQAACCSAAYTATHSQCSCLTCVNSWGCGHHRLVPFKQPC